MKLRHLSIIVVTVAVVFYHLFFSKDLDLKTSTKNPQPMNSAPVNSETIIPFSLDPNRTQAYFARNRDAYGNKADFQAIERLFGHANSLNLAGKESVVMVGGTNEGQLSNEILHWCPNITFYGFEIQEKCFLEAKKTLDSFPGVHMLNMGWSEYVLENVPIGGHGETAGLYDPNGQEKVNTIPLADFAIQQNITSVLYVVIDTEGHEPKVIRGMKLHDIENRKRFPLFQFELGGTWAARDNRHGNDLWTQKTTVQALEDWGYLTLLVGTNDWLTVDWRFFEEKNNPAMSDVGSGPFVQGNVLAMHNDFTPPGLKNLILHQVHNEG